MRPLGGNSGQSLSLTETCQSIYSSAVQGLQVSPGTPCIEGAGWHGPQGDPQGLRADCGQQPHFPNYKELDSEHNQYTWKRSLNPDWHPGFSLERS